MTSREMISKWFDEGLSSGALYMIIKYDNFDYEDYPCYVKSAADFYRRLNNDRVMEIYDLTMDKETQLDEFCAYHLPGEN